MTHVKDVEDPIEVPPPSGDCIFVSLRMEETRDRTAFALLDNFLLNRGHGPAIQTSVTGSLDGSITGSTHDVSFSIAPRRGLLSSSVPLSFNPRSRV